MSKMYYCPKGCHVTNINKDYCPHCKSLLRTTDIGDKDRILDQIKQMQIEAGKDYAKGRYVNNSL